MTAEVVSLRPDVHDGPVGTKPREPGYCQHTKVDLDTQAERVYCRKCGGEVPAFEALLALAYDYEHYVGVRNEAIRQAGVERDHLADVERRVKNAKARLRREVVKREAELPNPWWVEFDRALRRGHDRAALDPESIERIALLHAEQCHPGGRDA